MVEAKYGGKVPSLMQHREKRCIETPIRAFFMRSFPERDVLVLEEQRSGEIKNRGVCGRPEASAVVKEGR